MDEASSTSVGRSLFSEVGKDWKERTTYIVDTVRRLSNVTDPREVLSIFGERVTGFLPRDRSMTMSRNLVAPPKYVVTRFSGWTDAADPWTEREKLPVLEGGLLGELVYGNEPRYIEDLKLAEDDPGYEYLEGIRSLVAIPQYDRGQSMTMTLIMKEEPEGFDPEMIPEIVWTANIMGRTIHHLRLGEELKAAYEIIDKEIKVVSQIQQTLLPKGRPNIPGLDVAIFYETANQAGGDYYDFFPLPDGRWGILQADVSGHGAAAAVLMAVTHTIAHTYPEAPSSPAIFLAYMNERLATLYTSESKTFVTAFYGVYDPAKRTLEYGRAGHEPGRIRRAAGGPIEVLDEVGSLPLGVEDDESYKSGRTDLAQGDLLIVYTDGITETRNSQGEMFRVEGVDAVLHQGAATAQELLDRLVEAVRNFGEEQPPNDDCTVLVMRVV